MSDALQMTGINMVVGIYGQPGKPMLRETRGLLLKVQRPLRDLFKKVPELAIDVQVLVIHHRCPHVLLGGAHCYDFRATT